MVNKKKEGASAPSVSSVSGVLDHLKKTNSAHVTRMTEEGNYITVPKYLSTGLPTIDHMLGGGIAAGRITELFSKGEGIGKSSLAAMLMAEMQRQGGLVLLMDTEQGFTEQRLRDFGVNPDDVLRVEPAHIEGACKVISDTIKYLKNTGQSDKILIVWDSFTGTPSKQEVEADYGEIQVASSARALSTNLKKLKDEIAKSECYVLGISQTRENIGGGPFSEKHQATGGLGVKYYAAARIVMWKGPNNKIKEGDHEVGFKVSMMTEKCRVAAPKQKAEAALFYETGYDRWKSLFDLMIYLKLIVQKGGYYEMAGYDKSFRQADFTDVITKLDDASTEHIIKTLTTEGKLTPAIITYFFPAP